MKVASFTVRASEAQSLRWKRAADSEGFPSAGAWLSEAADAYLKVRARAGRPLPLAWRRERFSVILMDGREIEVRGMASPPFAYYQGNSQGPDHGEPRTLVNLRTGRIIATLRTARQCKALASELAPLYARDEASGAPVVARHVQEHA